jgi:rhodanese-related sulfurtransferase
VKALLVILLAACSTGSTKRQSMDVHALQAAMDSHPARVVVDVRTAVEYAWVHVPNAINSPLDRIDEAPELETYRDHHVHLICQCGARSRRAQESLDGTPWSTIHIGGGASAWRRAGYPIESSRLADGRAADGTRSSERFRERPTSFLDYHRSVARLQQAVFAPALPAHS